jgi:hypothetical protein
MKNNVLAIILAAGTAVVGSSLFSAPARALTIDQDVDVEINVPEVLYLRTFETLSLDITVDELAGVAQGTNLPQAQSGYDTINPTSDGTTDIDDTSPFAGVTAGTISKTVNQVYAVWSNNPNGFDVTLTNPADILTATTGGATATMSNLQKTVATDPATAVGLITPHIGGASFDLDLTSATKADTYDGGVINVEVVSP